MSARIIVDDAAIERAARGIWVASGHQEADWVYLPPESRRRQGYMAYARAALEAVAE